MDLARKHVALTMWKRQIAAQAREVETAIQQIEARLLTEIEEGRFPASSKVSGATLYLTEQTWASPKDGNYDAACDALEAVGLPEFSQRRFNTQTVSAYIREQEREGIELPELLANALKISTRASIGVRAS